MADHAFAGTSGNTSLRGLRERLVAVAQELAEERRRKRGINSSAGTTKRSSCTPVLDGSVLKNDIKQQLARERREEMKRQQEANKEKQLLEKEQKAKLQYEKQLEERHRKLKQQKEKDERRRVSAQEKRKQQQAEDEEKFKAVVSRTMERCSRADQRQKRWSWEGSAINTDKSGKTESKRSSSLNRKDNQLHPNVDLEHVNNTPESGNESVPSSEAAMKVLVETHHAAYEQKGKKEEERDQQETKQSISRKSEGMAERVDEVPAEEFSPHKDEKDLTRRHFEPPEDQKEQLEASEISDNCPSEEDEADDEGETESDEDSLEMFPSGMKTELSKFKKFHKNAKRRLQKLAFLQAGSGEVDSEKKVYFNENTKAIKQNNPKDSTSQAKGTKIPTKKQPTRTVRSKKTREANPTSRYVMNVTTNQEWVCDKIVDLSHTTESPVPKTTAESNKQDSKDSVTARQGPQVPLDPKKRGKPVSAPLTKVFSHLHLPGRATELENPFASGHSRMAFGGGEEDSDT